MFARRILAAVAFVAAFASAQLTINDPSSSSWWVADAVNTLAWSCSTSSYSAFTVVLSNSNISILVSPLALIPNVPNYDCSYTVSSQLSSQPPSDTYTLSFTNIQNITDIYASSPFSIKPSGSDYPASSSGASGTATGTSTAASASSTAGKHNGANANYVPVGMSMGAALLGLILA